MEEKHDIVIVGGGPAGIVAALTSKQLYPEKKILVIKKEEIGVVPCSIPYIFGVFKDVDKNLIPKEIFERNQIPYVVDEVVNIDRENKAVLTKSGKKIFYDKLILATGSMPRKIPIPGSEKKNVFYVHKNRNFLKNMLNEISEKTNIAIIGGGFIGLEIADELVKAGKNVTIIELLPHVISTYFDEDFSEIVEKKLKEAGVRVLTNVKVEKIEGDEFARSLVLSNGEKIEVDAVIIAAGAKPNTELAEKAGLEVSKFGIKVNFRMQTNDKDIFAIGDCAEKRDFLTGKPKSVMLASVASTEARIAALNLFGESENKMRGFIGTFISVFDDIVVGASGYTEKHLKSEGMEYISSFVEVEDRYPATLPDINKIYLKLLFEKESHRLVGAEFIGGLRDSEMINMISAMIEKNYTLEDIITMQFAAHPLVTPSPVVFPVVLAAQKAYSNLVSAQ